MDRIKPLLLLPLLLCAEKNCFSLQNIFGFRNLSVRQTTGFYLPAKEFLPLQDIPLYTDSDKSCALVKNAKLVSLQNTFSAMLTTTWCRTFYSVRFSKTTIGSLEDTTLDDLLSYSWGLNLYVPENKTKDLPVTCSFLAGNLTYGNSISRLKDNSLASPNALKTPSILSSGLAPQASTSTSFQPQDTAFALELKLQKHSKNFLQFSADLNGNLFSSINVHFSTSTAAMNLALTTACPFIEKTASTWYAATPVFSRQRILCSELNFNLSCPVLKTSQCLTASTSPSAPWYGFSFHTQNYLLLKSLTLSAEARFSTPCFVTADGTTCTTPLEICAGPEKQLVWNQKTINVGLLYYFSFTQSQTQEDEPVCTNRLYLDWKLDSKQVRILQKNCLGFTSEDDSFQTKCSISVKAKKMFLSPDFYASSTFKSTYSSIYTKISLSAQNNLHTDFSTSVTSYTGSSTCGTTNLGISWENNGKIRFSTRVLFSISW